MYQKEIIYIGLYKDGNRMGGAGYLKVERRELASRLNLKVQNVPLGINGRFPVRVYNGSDWKEINSITIQDGRGNWEDSMAEAADRTVIQVMLPGGYVLEGKSKSASAVPDMRTRPEVTEETEQMPQDTDEETVQTYVEVNTPVTVQFAAAAEAPKPVKISETERAPETVIVTEELPRRSLESAVTIPQSVPDYNLKEDKWEQILNSYENIHPYGDERVYVKLEPKDFVILQSKYQHLVNNSFLLHGFYNYRYVILGKERDYYLGVPGVFYEREKMVALMFGFEAFECPGGNVRAGEFGYYLRKVEL